MRKPVARVEGAREGDRQDKTEEGKVCGKDQTRQERRVEKSEEKV